MNERAICCSGYNRQKKRKQRAEYKKTQERGRGRERTEDNTWPFLLKEAVSELIARQRWQSVVVGNTITYVASLTITGHAVFTGSLQSVWSSPISWFSILNLNSIEISRFRVIDSFELVKVKVNWLQRLNLRNAARLLAAFKKKKLNLHLNNWESLWQSPVRLHYPHRSGENGRNVSLKESLSRRANVFVISHYLITVVFIVLAVFNLFPLLLLLLLLLLLMLLRLRLLYLHLWIFLRRFFVFVQQISFIRILKFINTAAAVHSCGFDVGRMLKREFDWIKWRIKWVELNEWIGKFGLDWRMWCSSRAVNRKERGWGTGNERSMLAGNWICQRWTFFCFID